MHFSFEVGTFHADPHAGNIIILEGGVIGYVDFGIVGSVDSLRARNERFLQALKDGRITDAVDATCEMLVLPPGSAPRVAEFRRELSGRIAEWHSSLLNVSTPVREKTVAWLLRDIFRLVRKFKLPFQDEPVRFYRALLLSEAVVRQLDPEFDYLRAVARWFRRRQIRRLRAIMDPSRLLERCAEAVLAWADAVASTDNGPRGRGDRSPYLHRHH